MAVTTGSPAPYTAGSAVITIIRRFREKGLTTPFTPDVLLRAGISDGLINRTMQALFILDLIDEKGMPTPTLQKIRVAPEKEYQACVADWLKSAYAEVFQFVDPATDEPGAVRDAFRMYEPIGQQDRMVALFMALCAEAGLLPEQTKTEKKPRSRPAAAGRIAPIALQSVSSRAAKTGARRTELSANTPEVFRSGTLPPELVGLMARLPQNGWTQATRDKFMATFEAVLDYVIPIVENEPQAEEGAP